MRTLVYTNTQDSSQDGFWNEQARWEHLSPPPADPADPSFLSSVNQEDYGKKITHWGLRQWASDQYLRNQNLWSVDKLLTLEFCQSRKTMCGHPTSSLTCVPSLPQSSSGRGAVKLSTTGALWGAGQRVLWATVTQMMEEPKAATAHSHPSTPTQVEGL